MSKVTVYGREDPSGTVRQIEFNPHFAGLRAAEGRKCGHQPVRVLEYVTNRHYLAIDRKSRPSGGLGAQLCTAHAEILTSWSARTRRTHRHRIVSLSITDSRRRRTQVVRKYEKRL